MGRMILITPRAARAYIHKIILDKWSMLARYLPDDPEKKVKKNVFLCCVFMSTRACFCPCRKVPAVTEKTKMNIDEMNINDIFNQDNATMLINTDPLTGEHVETEQEWTAAHERELLAMDAEKNQN